MTRPGRQSINEYIITGGEKLMNVHPEEQCKGRHCSIHNPSNHHMLNWHMHWRSDRGIMERICPKHGTGHPDPDHMSWYKSKYGAKNAYYESIHGCCGCCNPNNKYKDLD